jgi:hypothetical protein
MSKSPIQLSAYLSRLKKSFDTSTNIDPKYKTNPILIGLTFGYCFYNLLHTSYRVLSLNTDLQVYQVFLR